MIHMFLLAAIVLLAFPILVGYTYFWVAAPVALTRALIRSF